MTMLEAFIKERNEALFSLDRKKIEAYMIKYGETEIAQTPDVVFWASVIDFSPLICLKNIEASSYNN